MNISMSIWEKNSGEIQEGWMESDLTENIFKENKICNINSCDKVTNRGLKNLSASLKTLYSLQSISLDFYE